MAVGYFSFRHTKIYIEIAEIKYSDIFEKLALLNYYIKIKSLLSVMGDENFFHLENDQKFEANKKPLFLVRLW